MKMLFDFSRHSGWRPKASAACLALVLTVAAGCGKSNTPTTATPPPSDTTAAPPTTNLQVAVNPQPVAVANEDVPKPVMQAMNRALLGWMRANHRRPKTFEDFASSTDFQIPAPPPGKKYAFNERGFVVLVNDQ
jgi:hypothetical protein